MEECGFCVERENKIRSYEEEIEKEKVRECQKALEREKIAKGMKCTRADEKRVKEMQKKQVEEKKYINQEEEELEKMWHQVLVDDVRRKEQKEREDYERRQQEMRERRRAYDEQVASGNRKRQEAIRQEREKENRRLEKMRKKMEQDHYEAIKRKKDQQMMNRANFIEGHELKLSRLRNEKMREREIDNDTIKVALEELRRERIRNQLEMHRLQMEKQVCIENYNRKRRIASALEEDADRVAQQWKREEERKADDYKRNVEAETRFNKEKAAEEYRSYMKERKQQLERERQDRVERMSRVKRTAFKELQKHLDNANEEMRRQIEYRNNLNNQIRDNQIVLETNINDVECKQKPFTKKAEMFKDAMESKIAKSPGRKRNMDEERKFSMRELERCSYRYLQQFAKSMSLPSNVKKVYLIQLIYAKQNCSQTEVDSIVQRVKMERQTQALTNKKVSKKMRLQGTEISSTNNSTSPPIGQTPKRPGIIIQCSPDVETLSYPRQLNPKPPNRNRGSDRVLRSFNMKTYKRPNYSMMNDTLIGVVKSERDKQTQISIISRDGKFPNMNLTTRCLLKKYQPSILSNLDDRMNLGESQMVPVSHVIPGPLVPIKRQRSLSGIYPINPQPSKRYEFVQSVGFRRDDGRITKINALVQKSTQTLKRYENIRRNYRSIIKNNLEQENYQDTQKNYQETQKSYQEIQKTYQETQKKINYLEAQKNYQETQKKINYLEAQKNYQETQKKINYLEAQKNYQETQKKINYLEAQKNYQETQKKINYLEAQKNYQETQKKTNYLEEQKNYQETQKKINYLEAQKNYQETQKKTNYLEEQKNYQETQKIYLESQKNYQETQKNYQETQKNCQEEQKNYFDHDTEENRESQVEVTIQDIINSNIDAQTLSNPVSEYVLTDSSINYPNMSGLTDVLPNSTIEFKENEESFSVYYHKKIRAEQVRSQKYVKEVPKAIQPRLPKINEVFGNFSGIPSEVTQPLFVQVSCEAERLQNYPIYIPHTSTMLESLYNFRSPFLTHAPLLQVATTSNTKCVFSTPVIATAMQQPATIVSNDQCIVSSFERDSQYPCTNEDVSRMSDFLKLAEQEITLRKYHEALNSLSTSDTSTSTESHDLGASVTIPEMVEDALEIISQDGDYMERIGMDVRMQCILCSWAGPKIILEHHLRKEHSDQIVKQESNEWNITYKLGSLVKQQQWLSHVSQFESSLYILSVKYEDPERFMAALSTLSHGSETKVGSMTIYNKVTGEPYTWRAHILPLPTNMPYHFDTNHMQLELSSLNLLPNSANLKLLNGELVNRSPSKVVVGQPELNDIHIIIFVNIL